MTFHEFASSLDAERPPQLPPLVLALWHDAKGDWHAAHQLAQDSDTADGAWVHAYLHRKEGDESNAHYWYRRGNHKMSAMPLEQEWKEIATTLLEKRS